MLLYVSESVCVFVQVGVCVKLPYGGESPLVGHSQSSEAIVMLCVCVSVYKL